ncbi:MAG: hypothetical protein ACK6CT_11540 [Planctomycetia bacterium]|jgi:hypothetical protein
MICGEIFRRELHGLYADEETWPKDRSLKAFTQWFDVDHFRVVEDVGREPILARRTMGLPQTGHSSTKS